MQPLKHHDNITGMDDSESVQGATKDQQPMYDEDEFVTIDNDESITSETGILSEILDGTDSHVSDDEMSLNDKMRLSPVGSCV